MQGEGQGVRDAVARKPPAALSLPTVPSSSGISGPHADNAPTTTTKTRKSPPRLNLNGVKCAPRTVPDSSHYFAPSSEMKPSLVVEPASPAPDAAAAPSSSSSTTPYPVPIPSTSTASQAPPAYAGSFLPPPSQQIQQGGGLAARRAAKLGKKRLSLLVPANPHSSVPVAAAATAAGPLSAGLAGPDLTASSSQALLSPLTPSFLLPGSLKTPANGITVANTLAYDAETRSLPPSPLSLTTFIGPEGSEAPDRTIGRLMLKQQADEMREQMRGKRGMKRRTSIPRLNLVKTGIAQAQPANLDSIASSSAQAAAANSSSVSMSSAGLSRSASGTSTSAVQFLRSAENGGESGRRSSSGGGESDTPDGPVEEFPYALGPREILPGIYLGSEQNAKDAAVLRDWKIRFVLNVAKEVECPWIDEAQVLAAQDALERVDLHSVGGATTPIAEDPLPRVRTPTARRPTPPPGPRRAMSHTPDAPPIPAECLDLVDGNSISAADALTASPIPVRPTFIRPTASTPNLHASFDPPSSPPPPVPPLPDMRDLSAVYPALAASPESELLTLPSTTSSSSRRERASRSSQRPASVQQAASSGSSRSSDTIRIPSNPGSGRPELDYLWLKWGHDESDLVEAKKFQAAFDFLDEARERDERVLVHCQCGVSRSATVVIAYCMREAAKALEEGREAADLAGCTGMHDTYSFVKEKSEWVGPNLSLVFQLVAYERTLRGDSINGDDDLSEPPSAAFRSDPPRTQSDLPPPTPLDVERPFAFPPPTAAPPARPISRMINGTLASPHTPVSDASLAYSQMSTPELRDPLLSPAFSSATRSSSVTSTPLSPERQYGSRPNVRIVHGDADESRQGREPLDSILSHENARKGSADRVDSVFVLPVPPRDAQTFTAPTDATSPTVAKYPSSTPRQANLASEPGNPKSSPERAGLRSNVPTLSLDVSTSSRSARPGLPVLAPISASPLSASPPAALPVPSPQVNTEHLPAVFSPTSSASITPSPLSGSSGRAPSSSSTTSSQLASSESLLARSHSGRRFGAGQSQSERRASHRRVCSDTIRVPTPLGFTAATSPLVSSGLPASAATTPRANTPEVEVGPAAPL
ncbi:hypothetical protein JCM10908_003937 [Rhodotorula pacifica]|uniref:uncharacterized protein n=1 Tax=Rhodotorula pacifica TaxID=1495444 RepID=UPI00316BC661